MLYNKPIKRNSVKKREDTSHQICSLFLPWIKWDDLALSPDENFKSHTQQFPNFSKWFLFSQKMLPNRDYRCSVLLLLYADNGSFNCQCLLAWPDRMISGCRFSYVNVTNKQQSLLRQQE